MALKSRLREIVDGTEGAGHWFDVILMVLIVISVLAMALETLPGMSPEWHQYLWWLEFIITIIFMLEYCVRLYVADRAKSYVFSFYGVVDLLATLPYLIELLLGAVGLDPRAIKLVRLLRVVRLLKIARYSRAVARFKRSFEIVREEIFLYMGVALALLYLAALGIYHYEHEAQPEAFSSVFHSLWWALVTLTTVGYGDMYPITAGGKIFTAFVLMCGLGFVAVPAGLMASALSQARKEELKAAQRAQTLGKTSIIDPKRFTGHKPWEAKKIANFSGMSVKMHWTNEPMYWYENDSEEVLIVLDGELEVHYEDKAEEKVETLTVGQSFFAARDAEFKTVPHGEVRVMVIERN